MGGEPGPASHGESRGLAQVSKKKERVRVRINLNQPGWAHRVPVDCVEVGSMMHPMGGDLKAARVVEIGEASDSGDYFTCRCGQWQVVETTPKQAALYMLTFPVDA